MGKRPLVSVMVLAYRHSEVIKDALDSIFEQDYENIELIISDDCSRDFNRMEIAEYVQAMNRGNIVHCIINENEFNVGSVKHFNKILNMSNGQYLKFLAADDALYDTRVIRDFVEFFSKTDALVVTSQCMIYDEALSEVIAPGISETQQQTIRNSSTDELYRALTYSSVKCAPGACFKREFFDKYGPFDESYRIDEDLPMWLKISRLGCSIHLMDRVTVKYRIGGISNENTKYTEQSMIWYIEDLLKIWVKEILPHKELLGNDLWQRLVFEHLRRHEWPLTFSDPAPIKYF
jgi:glycosyltransferase involved in cell wall biosynthesis